MQLEIVSGLLLEYSQWGFGTTDISGYYYGATPVTVLSFINILAVANNFQAAFPASSTTSLTTFTVKMNTAIAASFLWISIGK